MVQELSQTQKNQARALTNLHNVVKLCNQNIPLSPQRKHNVSVKSLNDDKSTNEFLLSPIRGKNIDISS